MLETNVNLLALDLSHFTHSPFDPAIDMEMGSRLKPEYQESFYASVLVYVGNQCIKNRLGNIEDGRPIFTA